MTNGPEFPALATTSCGGRSMSSTPSPSREVRCALVLLVALLPACVVVVRPTVSFHGRTEDRSTFGRAAVYSNIDPPNHHVIGYLRTSCFVQIARDKYTSLTHVGDFECRAVDLQRRLVDTAPQVGGDAVTGMTCTTDVSRRVATMRCQAQVLRRDAPGTSRAAPSSS